MKQATIKAPGGLENLAIGEAPEPAAPGPGEIRVRVRASSLNYHDYRVCSLPGALADGGSRWPTAPARSRRWAPG